MRLLLTQGIEVEVLDVLAVKLAVVQLGEVLLYSPALGTALTHRLKDWARAASFYKGRPTSISKVAGATEPVRHFFDTSQPPETTKPLKTEVIQGLSF